MYLIVGIAVISAIAYRAASEARRNRDQRDDEPGTEPKSASHTVARSLAVPAGLAAAAYFSLSATCAMPAVAQASSLSAPGEPLTPIAPITSVPA
jgi:hypothetical protein